MHDHDAVGEDPVEHGPSDPEGSPRIGRLLAATAGAGVVLVYAWWAVAREPFSAAATAAVLLAGGTAALVGACRPARPRREVDARRAAPWAVLVAVAALWQLAAFAQHPREDHPTISLLVNELLASHPARAAAFVLWLLAAVRLARR